MQTVSIVQLGTLFIALIAAGSASYAAIITGRIQKRAAETQRRWESAQADQSRAWERLESDRKRGLEQLREAYEGEIEAVTNIEQYAWSGIHRPHFGVQVVDELFDANLADLARKHAARHSVVQLLGSPEVVEQTDLVGRDITLVMKKNDRAALRNLANSRSELIRRMRQDLGLPTARSLDADTLYASSKKTDVD
ncbi:hypothetical protein AB0J83_19745 [Actinoplanes sp. NPDC049596]|uniref:hypothetical protein n=1 Tax=unclassified Actinoplanes TaxID=2626549 RepID=UPI003412FC0A